MELVNNKKTNYHIVYHKYAGEAIRFAAMELQKYIYASTKTLIPVFSDKCEKRGVEIVIGNKTRGKDYMPLIPQLNEGTSEAFAIKKLEGDEIVLIGNSDRACLYAVYSFLEKIINLKCFHKDEVVYSFLEKIEFEELSYFKDQVFEYREVYFTDAFNATFSSMNYLNGNLSDLSSKYGGKVKWFNFHHSFSDLVSVDDYFETNPEYFSLVNGQRVKEHTQLCLSNNDVFKIALNKIKTWLRENPECSVVSVSQDEWLGHFDNFACTCPECSEIDEAHGAQSASIITFVNKIAKALEKEFPSVLIHTLAYQYSRKPPKKLKVHKNVIVRLCTIELSFEKSILEGAEDKNSSHALFLNDLKGWSKLTQRLYIWDYSVNFRNYLLPFPNLRSMYDNFLTYHEYNVKGILMQGNFSNGGKGYLDELKSYIIARLLNGSDTPLELLIKEFCDNYYKEASNFVYDIVMLFEDSTAGNSLTIYDDASNEMFNPNLLELSKSLIDKAIASCSPNSATYERVLALSLSIRYLDIVTTPLDDKGRTFAINRLNDDIRRLGITEIFERCNLDYSIKVLRESLYAKDRTDFYNLYYIMR